MSKRKREPQNAETRLAALTEALGKAPIGKMIPVEIIEHIASFDAVFSDRDYAGFWPALTLYRCLSPRDCWEVEGAQMTSCICWNVTELWVWTKALCQTPTCTVSGDNSKWINSIFLSQNGLNMAENAKSIRHESPLNSHGFFMNSCQIHEFIIPDMFR